MNLPKVGDIAEGTVVKVYPRYAILLFEDGYTGLLHISEVSHNFVRNFTKFVSVGNIYQVKVIGVDEEKENVKVSLKAMNDSDRRKALKRKRIPPQEIDFQALEKNLPDWIKAENAYGDKKDD